MTSPEQVQRAYTEIMKHSVEHGAAPHYTELAKKLGIKPDDARDLQEAAAQSAAGCWISHETDNIHSFAPFSNLPTHYRVSVDGEQKWYGQ
ncbi:MAG: hypothetical protein ACE5EF_07975 [Dehalococcoidia bacterium]